MGSGYRKSLLGWARAIKFLNKVEEGDEKEEQEARDEAHEKSAFISHPPGLREAQPLKRTRSSFPEPRRPPQLCPSALYSLTPPRRRSCTISTHTTSSFPEPRLNMPAPSRANTPKCRLRALSDDFLDSSASGLHHLRVSRELSSECGVVTDAAVDTMQGASRERSQT